MGTLKRTTAIVTATVALALAVTSAQERQKSGDQESFRFRSGVELINVTATVSDGRGRFVSGLKQEDFRVFEDGELRPITHFTAERVPVSLGIVLDASGSMEGEKMHAAKQALQRFLFDLLGQDDEVFLYRFDNRPQLVHPWTRDKEAIAAELRRIQPRGATTLYDAVAEAIPLAATGRNRKKALLIISDGNDSSSYTRIEELKRLIRESEVLVYAIGIDAMSQTQPYRRPWFTSNFFGQRRPTPFAVATASHQPGRTADTRQWPRRVGQRQGAERDHRYERWSDRNHLATQGPRRRDCRDRRRVEQAVLPWLSGREREKRWEVARDPGRGHSP
jgi:Mg-chelatase subunit ChlD